MISFGSKNGSYEQEKKPRNQERQKSAEEEEERSCLPLVRRSVSFGCGGWINHRGVRVLHLPGRSVSTRHP